MVALRFDYPDAETERVILLREAQVSSDMADRLVALAGAIRKQEDAGLREAASTRTMVSAARLIQEGVAPLAAVQAAMVQSLSDDPEIETAILEIARAIFR
jgi:nitric oxide reductase NorQ protein